MPTTPARPGTAVGPTRFRSSRCSMKPPGRSASRVVTDVSGMTLARFIITNADPIGGVLVTDQFKGYLPIGESFAKHERVNHSEGEYVRDGYSTNRLESFYSQLKRSIDGSHHNVGRE